MKHIFFWITLVSVFLTGCGSREISESSVPTICSDSTVSTEVLPSSEFTLQDAVSEPDLTYFQSGDFCSQYTSNTNDYTMDYWIFVPENAVPGMPLIVFLHGIGEVGKIEEIPEYGPIAAAKSLYGDEYPFVALYPNTKTDSWCLDPIHGTVMEIIQSVVDTYSIDTEHIIISGHSLGAIGTWYMLSEYGDYFSAAVPVSCGCLEQLDLTKCAQVPIWGFVGDSDQFEPVYEAQMRWLMRCIASENGNAKLTILTGDTHIDTKMSPFTPETFLWMLSQ